MGNVTNILKKVAMAMENGEYDFDGTKDAKVTMATGLSRSGQLIRSSMGHQVHGTI